MHIAIAFNKSAPTQATAIFAKALSLSSTVKFPDIIFESSQRVYFMLRVKKLVKTVALFTVVFGAGVMSATVALSYLPMVNANSIKVAQGLKQSKAEETDEEYGLKFRLQDCKRGGKTVICNVLATNIKNEDHRILIGWNSRGRAIDSSGNEYIEKQTKVGSSIVKDGGIQDINLIRGIPTKISYNFEIPQEVTKIAALEVNYLVHKKEYGNVVSRVSIRDINIGASQASNPATSGDYICPPQTTPKKPRPR